ncbi:hypothetical protein ACEPAI_7678 [Sanghuangporus weigelae]
MLHRLNTSLVTEHPKPGDRRPRNPSSGSSSSTIIPENLQLPIDAVHKTFKSDSVGEDFAIIKPARSPDRDRRGLETNNQWRDANRRSKADQSQGKELPDWLSHTFASLEPDHPLRGLAFSGNASSTCCGNILPNTETTAALYLNETYNDSVFTFTPPSQVALTADAGAICALHTESAAGETERDDMMSGLRTDGLDNDYHLTIDEFTNGDARSKLREFTPFAEPGPFAQKSVHFLTPVHSSPLAIATPRSHVASNLCGTNQLERDSSVYNPFSTPGPASSFSLPFFEHQAVGVEIAQDDSSDSLTLADQSIDEVADLVFTLVDESTATSTQSFVSNSENLREKLLSNPGPTILDASVQSIDSPPRHSLTPDFSVVNLKDRQKLPDERQEESQKMMRFISREHDRMAKPLHVPVVTPDPSTIERKISFGQNAQKGAFGLDMEQSMNPDVMGDIFISSKIPSITPCAIEDSADLLDITELSSSSSIYYKRLRSFKNESSLFRGSVAGETRDVSQEEFGPHHMQFKVIPPRIPATSHDTGGFLPTTPPNRLSLQAEHPGQSLRNQDSMFHSSTAGLEILTTKPSKPHHAFAYCSDICLSPIFKSEDTEYPCTKTAVLDKAKGHGKTMHKGIWNINPSQLSDDSIKEWEA